MNNNDKMAVLEIVTNIFELAAEVDKNLKARLLAHKTANETEDKLKVAHLELRRVVIQHGELHVDLNGSIFRINPAKDSENDVLIERIHIDCKRITAEV